MTQWTHTISRMVSGSAPLPLWYSNIAAANGGTFPLNTLFEVGKRWDDAIDGFNAKIVYPEVTRGSGLYAGLDGNDSAFHDGYGGSVYVPEIGAYGTMVFGATGEAIIEDQLSFWPISDDVPAWGVFQNPHYELTPAAAAAAGASWYYSVADYKALAGTGPPTANIPVAKPSMIMPWAASTVTGEDTWTPSWDRSFPIGRANWIITGKTNISEIGNNRPYHFRYNYPTYIPPSMTGWGAGAILTNDRSWAGSFSGQSGPPALVAASDWYTDIHPSGRRKFHIFAMNVQTRAWSVVATVPDFVNSYINVIMPLAFVDVGAKRVYYTADAGGHESLYYADFSAGANAVTVGGPTAMVESDGQAGFSGSHSNAPLFVGTSGALSGKKLYYFKNAFNRLGMIDLGSNTLYDLAVSNPPGAGQWRIAIDQANARVYIVVMASGAVTVTKFDIPSAPAIAANYALTTSSVNVNGIIFDPSTAGYTYGDRSTIIPGLGVMLINQHFGKMLIVRII